MDLGQFRDAIEGIMGSVWRKGWGPQSGGNFKPVLVTARWWVYEQGGEYTCRATWLQDILSSDLINNRDHSSKNLPKTLQNGYRKVRNFA